MTHYQKCYEVVGYAGDGSIVCAYCVKTQDIDVSDMSPVFAGDESSEGGDYCDICFESIDNTRID